MISCVACILLHDQTTHGTYLTLSDIYDFVRSVHLDARPNHAQNVIYPFRAFTISCVACILMHDRHTLSVIPCSVQLVARKNHARNVFISCVACILMHDQTTHGTYLTLSGIHDFVQQVARYDSKKILTGKRALGFLFSQEDYFNPAAARKSAARSIFSQGNCSRPKWP